jgi:maleylpyruvate isomerase
MSQIESATVRLVRTAGGLSDDQAREQSLLPGWTRGHVLTHIARNADGLRNLLTWALTGVETPQYPSLEARNAQIEEGAARPAADLAADVAESASQFVALARELSMEAWAAEVHGLKGPVHPAWFILHRRLFEVEVHHVDLVSGYAAADWPAWFVAEQLYRVTASLDANPATPAAVLADTQAGRQYVLRPDLLRDSPALTISGPGHELLAWLLGRDGGSMLTADPAGPLPAIPAYG